MPSKPSKALNKFRPHAYAWEKEYRTKGALWRGYNKPPALVRKGRVLELGCGNGKTLIPLAAQGLDVYGVDVSKTSLTLAKKALEEHGLKARLQEASGDALPFKNGFFDAVYAIHVIEHMNAKERENCAKEIARVLKKGGLAYFEAFAVGDARYGQGRKVERDTFRKGTNVWVHFFRSKEVERLFKKAGMHVDLVKEISRPERYGATRLERKIITAVLHS
jgi:2-polyprenyl-3-methyl-5-hydroxy-6-metoxy-1,4-benzoquinol methylase